jgi:hypothetical protein
VSVSMPLDGGKGLTDVATGSDGVVEVVSRVSGWGRESGTGLTDWPTAGDGLINPAGAERTESERGTGAVPVAGGAEKLLASKLSRERDRTSDPADPPVTVTLDEVEGAGASKSSRLMLLAVGTSGGSDGRTSLGGSAAGAMVDVGRDEGAVGRDSAGAALPKPGSERVMVGALEAAGLSSSSSLKKSSLRRERDVDDVGGVNVSIGATHRELEVDRVRQKHQRTC